MKILFKDDEYVYYITNSIDNITHLDDTKILYHYRSINSGESLPVYYEYNGRFIDIP